jgi:tetratricopeptide (TPR) repeat protein
MLVAAALLLLGILTVSISNRSDAPKTHNDQPPHSFGSKFSDQDPDGFLHGARCAYEQGNFALSKAQLEKAQELIEKMTISENDYANRGRLRLAIFEHAANTHLQLGEFDQALEMDERIFKLTRGDDYNAIHSSALGNVAQVHLSRGQYDLALRDWQQCADYSALDESRESSIELGRARVLFAMKRYEDALRHYRRSLELCGRRQPDVSYALGATKMHLDATKSGEALANASIEINLGLGETLLKLGKAAEARPYLKKAIDTPGGTTYFTDAFRKKARELLELT